MGINDFLDTENIKPMKKNASDFFSHHLHRYTITWPRYCQVFIVHSETNHEEKFVVVGSKNQEGVKGVPLQVILDDKKSTFEFSIFNFHCVINEITTTFWGHYQLHGGCMLNDDFHYFENNKPCQFCGSEKGDTSDFLTVPFIKEIRHVRTC